MDWAFGTALRVYGGEDAVRPLPAHALKGGEASNIGESVSTAAQLSWEEYKSERQAAREGRKETGGLSSWFGGGKEKNE